MNILTLLDMLASVSPDRIALGDRRDGLTYAALRERAAQAATLMEEQRDRPFLFAGTASELFPVSLFGAALIGRPYAPVSYRLAAEPFTALVADHAPTTLVADTRRTDSLSLDPAIDVLTPAGFAEATSRQEPWARAAEQDPDRAAVLLHTSGTTGKPKVAVLRHRHLTSYVLNSTEMFSAGEDEAALVSVPPYHIAGVIGLLTGLFSGRRIVQLPDFEEQLWVDQALAQDITHAMVVPTMLARIVDVVERTGVKLPALRHLSYGGGRMPESVIRRALGLLPHVDFVNGYGLTETTSSISVLGPADHRAALASDDPAVQARLGSVGKPTPDVEIIVRDASDQEVTAGVKGELWVRGAQVSGEYANDARLDADGWFRTRDSGWIDDEGYIFVEGRLDDVIVRGGENLSPGEIEDVLAQHADVAEAVVYGVPDVTWGEVPAAAVVLKGGAAASEAALQAWVADHLRSARVPAHIVFLEELPRNEMGKVLRRVLKDAVSAS
jgi:acyl-CoA synthetase (AMP-forming)/AMP-acid ligase II